MILDFPIDPTYGVENAASDDYLSGTLAGSVDILEYTEGEFVVPLPSQGARLYPSSAECLDYPPTSLSGTATPGSGANWPTGW